ncbi:MAG: glycosyltransferase [Treponema sp.]|jgi:rhamnosyl/mannosyltransferase|nr:glycosyltransferase [Treponema sp.]
MNDKIKVLQVNKFYAPWIGGVERIAQDIAEALTDKTDMKVLVCQPRGGGITEVYNGVPVTRVSSFGILYSMPISLDFIWKLRKMSKDADILQFHSPFPLGDFAYLLSGYKGKVVIWWHSDIISQQFLAKLIKPINCAFLKRADLIIVATKNHIESSELLKPFASKCKVIPFGLKFPDFEHVSATNFLTGKLANPGNKKLLFVGRVVYYKGIDVLINAMNKINGAELFIAGSGALEDTYKTLAKDNGVADKVHFLGYLPFEMLKAAYKDCDIFVFPSIANIEAFGIAQMEAMFYGKPVVNTDLPTGVPIVSLHGETGLTVKSGDIDGLAAAVQRLIDDEALRLQFGANAARRVRENFDFDKMTGSLYAEYERLVRGETG